MQGANKRPTRRMRQYAAGGSEVCDAADEPLSFDLRAFFGKPTREPGFKMRKGNVSTRYNKQSQYR